MITEYKLLTLKSSAIQTITICLGKTQCESTSLIARRKNTAPLLAGRSVPPAAAECPLDSPMRRTWKSIAHRPRRHPIGWLNSNCNRSSHSSRSSKHSSSSSSTHNTNLPTLARPFSHKQSRIQSRCHRPSHDACPSETNPDYERHCRPVPLPFAVSRNSRRPLYRASKACRAISRMRPPASLTTRTPTAHGTRPSRS